MNYLHRMSLSGYKSIRQMEDLEFTPLNVLIGANGAGKSNLISFFKMLNFSMTNSLKEYVARAGYANSILYRGAQVTKQITATLSFRRSQGHNVYELVLTHSDNNLIFTEEAVTWHKDGYPTPKRTPLGVGVDRTLLNDAARRKDDTVKEVRGLLTSARVYQFHDTSPTSPLRSKWRLDDNRYLFDHGGNLAPVLYYLRERQRATYDLIVSMIRLAAPFFEDFALEPDRLNPSVIDLRWRERESSYELGPHQISDGTLRFIALVTLLCQPTKELPQMMIIDEPELGLHPAAIGILGELIKAASASVQVFVSTQSVTLVNQMGIEDVMVAEREGGQSVFRRLNATELEPWLDDYGTGELWEKNLLGGRPR